MSLETTKEAREEIKRQQAAVAEKVKGVFHDEAKAVFAKHPKLESVSWTQYTPYFNDGDKCVFGVNNDEVEIKFDGKEHEYYGLSEYCLKRENNTELRDAAKDLGDFLGAFEEDDYRGMFGNHVKVTMTPEGISVEEYEHD